MTEASMRHLAAAIVERAVMDWHKVHLLLKENPAYVPALETKAEIERFFQGRWFEFLCDFNPDFTKIHLQEEKA